MFQRYKIHQKKPIKKKKRYTRKTAPMSPSKSYPKHYGWWRVILSPSRHWAPAFIAPFANFLQFQQCQSFGGFQWTRQIWGFTQVWWAFMMMVVIWYHHQLSIPLNTVRNDSYLVCIEHLSLPSSSGLPMDVANGSDFGLGFDLTVGYGFNLGSSSLVYPSVNDDFDFNPYPQLKKMKTS